jgi:SSS family solute:Na+ symporter
LFFGVSLTIGAVVSKRAGRNAESFFLSGRNMPWWLLGISMVATTFAADTPLLVTDIVRNNGVAGNWVWWAFLLTGMLTTFVYARLWRRSGVMTDLEFYELRYSGRPAMAVRAFRAVYLGVFFNVMVMATVSLAAIKISAVMLGASPWQTILVAGSVTLIFSSMGGFVGVVFSDLVLFAISMLGAVAAAWFALDHPAVGDLPSLLEHANVRDKLSMLPDFSNHEQALMIFIIPLTLQWWNVWYPGSEPGGGGYVAQRMLAAKNERHAMGAVLLFQIAHYALRPWPWIVVALASLVVFPDIASIQAAFPAIDPGVISDDFAYPAMLTFLPTGLLGLVVASLISAYMSTMSTQINWGSSYIVNDFYGRFVNPGASEKALVRVGRLSSVALMVMASILSLFLESAMQAFNILLTVGAGTGLLFILRWFWWRINAWSEIAAMAISFVAALFFQLADLPGWAEWHKLVSGILLTTSGWLLVTFLTPASSIDSLTRFYQLIKPVGPGWQPVRRQASNQSGTKEQDGDGGQLALSLLCLLVASIGVYSLLFAIGYGLYGDWGMAGPLGIVALTASLVVWRNWAALTDDCPGG